jgi:hydroxymethylglutaryl-CoA reductase (NADPH)
MPSAMRAAAVKRWLGSAENYHLVEAAFNSTTNYGRLESIEATIAGRNVVGTMNAPSSPCPLPSQP